MGNRGPFGGLSVLNGPLLAALAARELPRSPKGLTVAVTYLARWVPVPQRLSQLFWCAVGAFRPFVEYRYTSRDPTNKGDTWQHRQRKRTWPPQALATRLPVQPPPLRRRLVR